MILLDVQPSRTYFVSLFEELNLSPNIAFSSPSIEMVRGMVGQGFGLILINPAAFGMHLMARKWCAWTSSKTSPVRDWWRRGSSAGN